VPPPTRARRLLSFRAQAAAQQARDAVADEPQLKRWSCFG
jgi:hypothetical protein